MMPVWTEIYLGRRVVSHPEFHTVFIRVPATLFLNTATVLYIARTG